MRSLVRHAHEAATSIPQTSNASPRLLGVGGFAAALIVAASAACSGPAGQAVATNVPRTAGPASTAPSSPPLTATPPSATVAPTGAPWQPRISFEGSPPAGWSVTGDAGTLSFTIEQGGEMSIDVLPNRSVADDGCTLAPEPGIGTTVSEIIDALAARRGVTATGRTSTNVAGLSGIVVDLALDAATGATCPTDEPGFVPLVGNAGAQGWEFVGVAAEEKVRLYVLDPLRGRNLVIYVSASSAELFAAHEADVSAILAHLEIDLSAARPARRR